MCEVAHLCATLCNPVDCSLPGSSVHGIFQPRVLEWVAISFSRAIFLIQGSNPDLSHCRQMLYRLSHQGSNSKKYSLFIWNSNLTQYPLVSWILGFPGSSAGKESVCNAGDPTLIPGSGRYPGEGIDYPLQYSWAFLVAQTIKKPPAIQETWIWSLGWEDPLEKGMATQSSILAWRISRTEEPGRQQSMGSQRVRHD